MKNKHVALLFSIVLLLQWGCGKKQAVMQDAEGNEFLIIEIDGTIVTGKQIGRAHV